MEFNQGIKVSDLKLPPVNLDVFKNRLKTGNCVLFTGAGFSLGTKNSLNEEPPLAKGLSKKIAGLIGIEEDADDLKFISNLYMRYQQDKLPLLNLLKDNFVLKEVSESHKIIGALHWKRFYTTNYDNSIELACIANNTRIESVDITAQPKDFLSTPNLSVHINGYISKATVDDLNEKIKLSDSSYLSPTSFINSHWRTIFKRDLETCSALVFAGYSLYDFDVQKLLFELPHLKEKTYFITHEGASFRETFEISQFGHVLPIGLNNFSNLVKEVLDAPILLDEEEQPEAFQLREVVEGAEINDLAVSNLLLYGEYSSAQIDNAISQDYLVPFVFKRTAIEQANKLLQNGENVLVHSDLGNGKTIFLDTLASHLALDGVTTYVLENTDGDYLKDIELLSKLNNKVTLIIDSCHFYSDMLDYLSILKPQNITVIISDRNVESMRIITELEKLELKFNAISLDSLDDDEVGSLIKIIDDQGFWEELTSLPFERKFEKICSFYNKQLSGVLLGLLNSPQISQKIKTITNELFKEPLTKKTVFAIALCDVLGIPKRPDIISDIADNDEIYTIKLRENQDFKNIYKFSKDHREIETKSSLLSLFIINKCFSETYVKKECLRIEGDFNKNHGGMREKIEVYKSLLRFHFMEKLMPQKKNALNNYYMELKRECTWLTEHPHFWVQYAMCKLTFDDFETADRFLANAYSLADKKEGYHTENIDTQQARLNILKSIETTDSSESFKMFSSAHQLLLALSNDGYKFRQVLPYKEVYYKKYTFYSKKNKVQFEHFCNAMIEQIEKLKNEENDLILIKRVEFISQAEEILKDIIADIKKNRLKG